MKKYLKGWLSCLLVVTMLSGNILPAYATSEFTADAESVVTMSDEDAIDAEKKSDSEYVVESSEGDELESSAEDEEESSQEDGTESSVEDEEESSYESEVESSINDAQSISLSDDEEQVEEEFVFEQILDLPIVQEGSDLPTPQGIAGGMSAFALVPNNQEYSYAYYNAGSAYIGHKAYIYEPGTQTPVTEKPAMNGLLQVVDENGDVLASATVSDYNCEYTTQYYYIQYCMLQFALAELSEGVYGLQLAAGSEIYPCSGKLMIVGEGSLFVDQANVENFNAGVSSFDIRVQIYGFETEEEVQQLSFQLIDSNNVVIAKTSGAFKDISMYSAWSLIAEMKVVEGQSITAYTDYTLRIVYSGEKTVVDGVGGATCTAYSTTNITIADIQVVDAQAAMLAVELSNWDAKQNYRITVESALDGNVYGSWSGIIPNDGVVRILLLTNDIILPMNKYPYSLAVSVYEGDADYRSDYEYFYHDNSLYEGDVPSINFEPQFISSKKSAVPFTIEYNNCGFVKESGNVLKIQDVTGNVIGECNSITVNKTANEGVLTGVINIFSNVEEWKSYVLYLNDVAMHSIYFVDGLYTPYYPATTMSDYDSKTFWFNLEQMPISFVAYNTSGSGNIIFYNEQEEIFFSEDITGDFMGHDGCFQYIYTLDKNQLSSLTNNGAYMAKFRDKNGDEIALWGLEEWDTMYTYNAEVKGLELSNSNHAYFDRYNVMKGDDYISGTLYLDGTLRPKNITFADIEDAVKRISVSNEYETIYAIGYRNGRWEENGNYDIDIVLAKSLDAGEYTMYEGENVIGSIAVSSTSGTEKNPSISGGDVTDGSISAWNLPIDATYTGKIYNGYNCLTKSPVTLTLYDDSGNQKLGFPDAVISALKAGEYELRVYMDGKIFDTTTISISGTEPIIWINDGDPVITNSNVQIKGKNLGSYSLLRWAETQEALAKESFRIYRSWDNYYTFTEDTDGKRTLYVELSKTGKVSDEDNIQLSFDLWMDTNRDYGLEVSEEIHGIQNTTEDYVIMASVELPATNVWVSFYDAGGKHASKQMEYYGEFDGCYWFILFFEVGPYDGFYDYNSYGDKFYFNQTQSIRVFTTDMSGTYNEGEAYSGNILGTPIERVLIFGDPSSVILPQFSRGEVYINKNNYLISGYAKPNSTVTITENGGVIGTGTASNIGYFSIELSNLSDGSHWLTVADNAGTESKSVWLSVDATAPVVADVTFQFLPAGNAVLRWVCDDTDIDYFEIYKNGKLVDEVPSNSNSYNVMAKTDDGNLFTVKAYDKAGNMGERTVSTADTQAPTAPEFAPVAEGITTTTLSLSWTAGTDDRGISGYNVYQDGTKIAELKGEQILSYDVTGLTQGKEYTFTVKTRDQVGNLSDNSPELTVTTAKLTATDMSGFADSYIVEERTYKTIPAKFAVAADVTDYEVKLTEAHLEYKLTAASDSEWISKTMSISTLSANSASGNWDISGDDDGYLPAGKYSIRFVATDEYGAEVVSEPSEVVLKHDDIEPQISRLTPESGTLLSGKEIRFYFNASDNVTVERIEFSYTANGVNYTNIGSISNADEDAYFGDWYTWDASALKSGEYTIRAIAYDMRGNESTPRTTTLTIDNTAPEVPGGFTVKGTSRYIHVMWDSKYAPVEDFHHFNIYRGEDENGPFSCVKEISSIGYYDDGRTATNDRTYYYYVTAEDKLGNESEATPTLSAVMVADDESPSIVSMLPVENATLRKTVDIKVSVEDNYRLAKAVFEYRSQGGTWVPLTEKVWNTPVNNTVYSYSWDISGLTTGTYEIRAKVYDDSINDVEENSGYSANEPAVVTRAVQILSYSAPVAPVLNASASFKAAELRWSYGGDVDTLRQFEVYQTDSAGEEMQYVSAVKAAEIGNYKIDIPATGNQYFIVKAVDKYGKYKYSNIISVTSVGSDTELPVSVIQPETLTAAVGIPFVFSGANSSDNDVIESYTWDFGDGSSAGNGKVCEHTYSNAGEYKVRLTVTDATGNSHSSEAAVKVYDVTGQEATHALMTIKVVNGYVDGTPAVNGANIELFNEESGFSSIATSGANGEANVVVPIGKLSATVAADGYVVTGRNVDVDPDETGHFVYTIGLVPVNVSTVDGSLSYEEMTYDEILQAGIDVKDPDNNHVWKFETKLEFVAGPALPFELPITGYFNSAGEFVGGDGWGWNFIGGGASSFGGMKIGVFPISEKFILVIYGEAHWLKEMYNVELIVINNSYTDKITDCEATLQLPDGLSFASMIGTEQTATIDIGTIDTANGNNTAKVNWYVRGDTEGEYNLTATVTGNNPEPFVKTFTTDKPLKVYAGSALHLTITAQDIAYRGEEYHVQFKLENVSDKELYNLSFGITGAEQFKVFGIGNATAELPLTHEDFADGMTQRIDVLKPGGSITIDFTTTTWFNSALELVDLGPFDVGYYLANVFVTTLEGSTTEIPYTVDFVHVPHGSFLEYVVDKLDGEAEDFVLDVIEEEFIWYVPILENVVKAYEFATTDTTDASSKAYIIVDGGYFTTNSNNFLRSRDMSAVSVYTDADEDNYTISADGKTMILHGPAKIYVKAEAPGEANVTVTTQTYNLDTQQYEPNVYRMNYVVSDEQAIAEDIILQEPETSIVAVPFSGENKEVKIPYMLVDSQGNYLSGSSNATWTINGSDTTGLIVEDGVLQVSSTANAGTYTIRLALSDTVYEEQTVTLTKEPSVATSVKLYRESNEVSSTDTLIVPPTNATESDTYIYTAKLMDQYGVEISGMDWEWEISNNTSGVASAKDGVVTLAKDTTLGKFTLTAIASGKSASVVVNVTNLKVDWSEVESVLNSATFTYGDVNGKVTLPESGTATALTSIKGYFSYQEPMAVQDAGDRKITVIFTANVEAGDYAGDSISREFNIVIDKKTIDADMITISGNYVYTGEEIIPSYTVSDGSLIKSDDYAVTVSDNIEAGSGWLTVTATEGGNYTGSASKQFDIEPASITGFLTVAPNHSVLASDAINTDTSALKTIANSGSTLPDIVVVTFGEGTTHELPIIWADSDDSFDAKGGVYTYRGSVLTGNNFNTYDKTLDAIVTVKQVVGTAVWVPMSVTKAMSEVQAASSLTALGLPNSITIDYDNGVDDGIYSISDSDYSVALDTLKGYDVSGQDRTVTISLSNSVFPAWATIDTSGFETIFTITEKYPVEVIVTAPEGVTYGDSYEEPTAGQVEIGYGTDANATYIYEYKLKDSEDSAYTMMAPKDAGSYIVRATLNSDTHSGSGVDEFTIIQKTLNNSMISEITDYFVYDGSEKTPQITISDIKNDVELISSLDYTVSYSNNVNAGEASVVVTAKTDGNYIGTVEKKFIIEAKDISAENSGVTVRPLVDRVYTGDAIKAIPTVNEGEKILRLGEDYEVSYANNTLAGQGKVVVSGKGNYKGDIQQTFTILPQPITAAITLSGVGSGSDGRIVAGDILEVDISESTVTGTYQWLRDGEKIQGAEGNSYILTLEDVDKTISVMLTGTQNYSGTVVSEGITVGKIPLNGTITLSKDTPVEPDEILVVTGVVNDVDVQVDNSNYIVQWMRNGQPINGATSLSYKVTENDRGNTISLVAIAIGDVYTGSVYSTTVTVNTGDPIVSLKAIPSDKQVKLEWSIKEAGSPIQKIGVFMGDGEEIVLANDVDAYLYGSLENGREYTFKIVVYSEDGKMGTDTQKAIPTEHRSSGGSGSAGIGGSYSDESKETIADIDSVETEIITEEIEISEFDSEEQVEESEEMVTQELDKSGSETAMSDDLETDADGEILEQDQNSYVATAVVVLVLILMGVVLLYLKKRKSIEK